MALDDEAVTIDSRTGLGIDNSEDPVTDNRFPNIVEYDPYEDDPESEDHGGCITETMEEVNPDG